MKEQLLVTGDVVLDHNIYNGKRSNPGSEARLGTHHILLPGGAMLSYQILKHLGKNKQPENNGSPDRRVLLKSDILFGLQNVRSNQLQKWPTKFHFTSLWKSSDGDEDRWLMDKTLGYGSILDSDMTSEETKYPGIRNDINNKISLCVIDDGALGFRFKTAGCWPNFLKDNDGDSLPEWIILKVSAPVVRGDLWRVLSDNFRDQLVVIVSAGNLRREDAQVSQGLSWENAIDDILDEIHQNPRLHGLMKCRHLIITLRNEAALWMNLSDEVSERGCRLIYDREFAEGEWELSEMPGNAYGYQSAMTASLAYHLWLQVNDVSVCIPKALKAGLSACRRIRKEGHKNVFGKRRNNKVPVFPFKEIAEEIREFEKEERDKFSISQIPCDASKCCEMKSENPPDKAPCKEKREKDWSLFKKLTESDGLSSMIPLARRLALKGPGAFPNVPFARFGKLLTMDRREIEALRTIRQLMSGYSKRKKAKKPLCIGVFGAPGAGKSFGLEQIAECVFGSDAEFMTFNLSQFNGPEDLIGAYHQARDESLSGKTPVAFFDEFDSKNYKWLQYLLAPMQDGKFQEGQLTHSIGKCIFVFAGSTTRDFEHFGIQKNRVTEAFVMAKGPDFKSRLDGYYNVEGPNRRRIYDAKTDKKGEYPWKIDVKIDSGFLIRRAILLRAFLGYKEEKENDCLKIDMGLLEALIRIDEYMHGARSMEKLLTLIRERNGDGPIRRSSLPPDHILALYVDNVGKFHEIMNETQKFRAQAESLAPHIHNHWWNSLSEEEKERRKQDEHYEGLSDEYKESNIAAARRIPYILSIAGLTVIDESLYTETHDEAGISNEARAILINKLEDLAIAEHNAWMEQKRLEGWIPGKVRSEDLRIHDSLVPYDKLPEEQKEKDRQQVKSYPDIVSQAGYIIVKKSEEEPEETKEPEKREIVERTEEPEELISEIIIRPNELIRITKKKYLEK